MDRARRPAVVWLLWLLLALLPWRGVAQGHMALAMPSQAAESASMPCHGVAPAGANSAHHPSEGSPQATTCPHCDLCHSTLAPNEPGASFNTVSGHAPPQAQPDTTAPQTQADSLFRPPRP